MKTIDDARLRSLEEMPFGGRVLVTQSSPEERIEAVQRGTGKRNGALDGNVIAFSLAGEKDEKRIIWKLFNQVFKFCGIRTEASKNNIEIDKTSLTP